MSAADEVTGRENHPVLFRGVFLVALATLLLEITLIRILSFTIWYHFAYVVISIALLGFGASGSLVAVLPQMGARDLRSTLARASLVAAVTGAAFVVAVALLPLNPMSIVEDRRELLILVVYLLGAVIPFIFSGLTISLALKAAARRVDRLYFWDLVGGGLGCAAAVVLMNYLSPPGAALLAAAVFGLGSAAFAATRALRVGAGALTVLLLVAAPFGADLPYTPARTKHLSQWLSSLKMKPTFTRWTALFRTDVVERSPDTPSAPTWGISRTATNVQQACCIVSHDGTASTPVYDMREGDLDFLDEHILRMPYLIVNPAPRVLVIGVGGGLDVIAALRHGASNVTGVELDPVTIDLVQTQMDDVTQGLFRRPEVELVAGEGRHFVKRSDKRFDLIQLTGVDTLAAQTSGAYVLAENYLYTVEAFHDYLDHLAPGGVLSITMAHLEHDHPRALGRIVSVAHRALLERGADRPQDRILVIDSRRLYAGVLIGSEAFTPVQVERLAREAKRLRFPILHAPGLSGHPVFNGLASATGEERDRLLADRRFVVHAITDDSPFFFHFFRWQELLDAPVDSPVQTTALGQAVLLVLLVSLTFLGVVFVLGPLLAFHRRGVGERRASTAGILFYFLAVGFGFMLFEISLMQRFVLYLGYPTYSLSVVLFSLLVFLGCGSYLSRRLLGREGIALPLGVMAIGLLTLFYMKGLPIVQEHTLGTPLLARISITLAVLAPLGLVLGIFFPLGIRHAERVHENLVPWAWAINGCASVTATVLAVVLAMSFGFARVWILSCVIYALGVGALLVTRPSESSLRGPH